MTRTLSVSHLMYSILVILALAGSASAQSPTDDDAALDPAEPDFTVVNLPTTLRLPVGKGDFHLTHRFAGNLRQGTFGDQAGTLFGLDLGATIGLEYRYGVMRHLQAGVHRSGFDKTVEFFAKYDAVHQADAIPVSLSGVVSIEGPNNFRERYAPTLGAVISRKVQDRLAVYVSPVWVHNSAAALGENRETLYVGLGARARIASTVYVVGEASPRVAGYAPGQVDRRLSAFSGAVYGFGIEKRAGAHVFQLTFANSQLTTLGQLARGGSPESLYLGFNLTRKFF